MNFTVDQIKRLNLAEFLGCHYGLCFADSQGQYVCHSPFTDERTASFFVRQAADGHWLFKDFSSGHGGSIFDFVMVKEAFSSFNEALMFIRRVLGKMPAMFSSRSTSSASGGMDSDSDRVRVDISVLYSRFKRNDVSVCREYLLGRGIAVDLVDKFVADGVVVHNEHDGHSYCCFLVRDRAGQVCCLDNHEIGGKKKFILGNKHVFSEDFVALRKAAEVFVCESIIDYLSVRTLEPSLPHGIALLGSELLFGNDLFAGTGRIVSVLDDDQAGYSALFSLKDRFADHQVDVYDLEGHNDVNDLLQAVKSGRRTNLSSSRKIQLVSEFYGNKNKSELARRWGVDRSYMYEIVAEAEAGMKDHFDGRQRGRPTQDRPRTLTEALEQLDRLKEELEREAHDRELYYARSEFLKLHLQFARDDLAAAGLPVPGGVNTCGTLEKTTTELNDSMAGRKRRRQLKKKRKRR